MNVFKIKYIENLLGVKRSMIKRVLLSRGIITKSWAVVEAKGYVVELREPKGDFVETTLLLTSRGINLIREEACDVV